ncbi:uncharacterized protein F4812DRAFT_291335 [Daldinia caldariorum]|uniref:uncharacterized protein n=1 Tax=Daldinia caldariorum TaxID=326644 RepID=UPI0020083772|nr:uncharacterized protein F4812DRAFT_291335 [Daldinia caldariorum]KAI1462967.1 hypothetical protein F4812DRAFT_291335 [Daldinia caldariorum]
MIAEYSADSDAVIFPSYFFGGRFFQSRVAFSPNSHPILSVCLFHPHNQQFTHRTHLPRFFPFPFPIIVDIRDWYPLLQHTSSSEFQLTLLLFFIFIFVIILLFPNLFFCRPRPRLAPSRCTHTYRATPANSALPHLTFTIYIHPETHTQHIRSCL